MTSVTGTGFSATIANGLMSVAALIPVNLKNSGMRGLYGNYNGVQTDDLISSTGTQISITSSEEDIYYQFGLTCEYRWQVNR